MPVIVCNWTGDNLILMQLVRYSLFTVSILNVLVSEEDKQLMPSEWNKMAADWQSSNTVA